VAVQKVALNVEKKVTCLVNVLMVVVVVGIFGSKILVSCIRGSFLLDLWN